METLLKAAGLISEDTIARDDFGEEDEHLDDESDDDERYDPYPELGREPDSASVGQESIDIVDTAHASNRNPPDLLERRRSEPCSNIIQEPHVFRWDNREDSRYYGRLIETSPFHSKGSHPQDGRHPCPYYPARASNGSRTRPGKSNSST